MCTTNPQPLGFAPYMVSHHSSTHSLHNKIAIPTPRQSSSHSVIFYLRVQQSDAHGAAILHAYAQAGGNESNKSTALRTANPSAYGQRTTPNPEEALMRALDLEATRLAAATGALQGKSIKG
jgi:hypothetical protein